MVALSNSCYVSIDWKIPFSFTKKYPQNIKTKLKNKVTIKLSVPNKESFSISFFNGVFCCCLVLFFNRSDRSSVVTASSISYQYWDTNFLFLLRSAHHIYISEHFRTDHLIKRTGLHVFRTNPLVSNNCLDTAFWLLFFFLVQVLFQLQIPWTADQSQCFRLSWFHSYSFKLKSWQDIIYFIWDAQESHDLFKTGGSRGHICFCKLHQQPIFPNCFKPSVVTEY